MCFLSSLSYDPYLCPDIRGVELPLGREDRVAYDRAELVQSASPHSIHHSAFPPCHPPEHLIHDALLLY